ncbi:HNH endonuclease signature motif containing protein [Amnibacterium setariae]|uniref:HNH endonuclease n=1 Tax=Amnibacterium setariae TaxID=2306585 RepID=A0A3A1TW41_9MICO|nr:HNH endonuclease signature motif containing protein [Amnibacterium setariae]RIX28009.1 HNH endonuclease [Amnibacterium setariae]
MNRNAEALQQQVDAYVHGFDRVSASGRFDDASSDGPVRLLSDQELLEATDSVSRLVRLAESERAKLAGEIARRSEIRDETNLARTMGTSSPAALLAQVAGIPREQAGTITALATAVQPREAIDGTPLPAKRAHVAAALALGCLDVSVAAALVRSLKKVENGLTPLELEELERQLVERCQEGYTADELLEHFRLVPAYAYPEGNGPTDGDLAGQATVTKRKLDNGLTRWVLDLDPLTAGFFETALDANTSQRRFQLVLDDAPKLDDKDLRPLNKRRVDGVQRIAKKVLKIDDGHVAGTAVTMLVTISEEALRTGIGHALLPGCMETISAATARMLAAEAEIIPVVLGGDSQPLDLGTGRRFFSEAQRRAMAVRDQGCAGPNCDAPLSWCDAAHIDPAGYGSTSIENGILLCWRCHRLHDEHGWQVAREDGRWWWTPPPHVDPRGRRRPGGPVPPVNLSA